MKTNQWFSLHVLITFAQLCAIVAKPPYLFKKCGFLVLGGDFSTKSSISQKPHFIMLSEVISNA